MWDDEGQQLDMPQAACREMVAQGVPLHYLRESTRANRRKEKETDPGAGWNPADTGADAPSAESSPSFGQLASYGKDGLGAY